MFISISELYRIDRNLKIYRDINFGHIVQPYIRVSELSSNLNLWVNYSFMTELYVCV